MPVRRFLSVCVLVAVAFAAAACSKDSPSSPSAVNVPFTTTDLTVGTGAEATSGKRLSVHYSGWLYSAGATDNKGTMFDSSLSRGPFSFTLGTNAVIAGWDQGCVGMKVGGVRRLIIPPSLGYGSQAVGSIPANSTLVFDIQLLSVQ